MKTIQVDSRTRRTLCIIGNVGGIYGPLKFRYDSLKVSKSACFFVKCHLYRKQSLWMQSNMQNYVDSAARLDGRNRLCRYRRRGKRREAAIWIQDLVSQSLVKWHTLPHRWNLSSGCSCRHTRRLMRNLINRYALNEHIPCTCKVAQQGVAIY